MHEVSAGLGDFAAGETLLNDVLVEIDIYGFALAEGGRLILEDVGLWIDVDDWLFIDGEGLLMIDLRLMDDCMLRIMIDGLVLRLLMCDDFLVCWLFVDWLPRLFFIFWQRI